MKKFTAANRLEIALVIGIISTILLSNFTAFANFTESYDDLCASVVRLHILANSDSDADQALKLAVRDEILREGGAYFDDTLSMAEAEKNIAEHLDFFQSTAQAVVTKAGYDYPVKCEMVNMYFDERKYESFSFPAGDYEALRITIGEAAGHNWWCVMYPPLCLPAAMDVEDYGEIFTKPEIEMMKSPQKFKIKFKLLEIFEQLENKFASYAN